MGCAQGSHRFVKINKPSKGVYWKCLDCPEVRDRHGKRLPRTA